MSVQFEIYGSNGVVVSSNSGDGSKVDWDALNNYIVETCGLQDGDTLVGYGGSVGAYLGVGV